MKRYKKRYTSMNCSIIRKHTDDYLDGFISDDLKTELEAHLIECPDCKKYMQEMNHILHTMASIEDEDLPEGFSERLHLRLQEEVSIDIQSPSKKLKSVKWYRWGAGLAAAIVLLLSIKLLDQTSPQPDKAAEDDSLRFSVKSEELTDDANASNAPEILEAPESRKAPGDVTAGEDLETPTDDGSEAPETSENSVMLAPFSLMSIQTNEIKLYIEDKSGIVEKLYIVVEQNGISIIEEIENGLIVEVIDDEQRTILYAELANLGQIEEIGVQDGNMVTIHIIED